MDKHKESLSIFMGGSSSEASLDLFIDNPKGLLHSNNIDFRNSLSKTQSVKFESDFASSILDFQDFSKSNSFVKYNWSAQKVKILEDFAFVSYPEYTDINKVHITDTNGGLYRPFAANRNINVNDGGSPSDGGGPIPTDGNDSGIPVAGEPASSGGFAGCPTDYSSYSPYKNYLILPDLTFFQDMVKWDFDFSNLFIVVEYDGWTTDASGNIIQAPLGDGRFEVFEYGNNSGKASTWSYDIDFPFNEFSSLKYPVLYSKYTNLVASASPEIYNDPLISDPITSPRLLEPHVSSYDLSKLDSAITSYQSQDPSKCYRFGFLGYSKIHYIKYTPIIECGRVDIYQRKHGVITSYNNSYISPSHKLKSGDIVEIVSSNGQDPSIACGTRYVQVRDSNSFFLYEDSDFTRKIEDVNIRFAVYNCVGNIYDKNDNGWKYRQSLFSPHGRNGECIPQQAFSIENEPPENWEDHRPIPRQFNKCKTYLDILTTDILGGYQLIQGESLRIIPDSFYNLDNPMIKPRNSSLSSGHDCLWVDHRKLVNSYRFGSDIDVDIRNGTIFLAVGERGIDRWINTEQMFFSYNKPNGKVHLFEIFNQIDYNNTIFPGSFTSIPLVESSSFQTLPGIIGFCSAPYQTPQSSTLNPYIPDTPHNFTDFYLSTSNIFENDYWFGSMLMGRESKFFGPQIFDYVRQYNYSSDMPDPTIDMIKYGSSLDPEFTRNGDKFYALVDSFGKSVAIKCLANEIILAIGSNAKTLLQHPTQREKSVNDTPDVLVNYDYSYNYNSPFSLNDFGYIHLVSYESGLGTSFKVPVDTTTFSKSYWAQKYACENFAKCMMFDGTTLYFGEPRSPDVTSENTSLINQNRSKIYSISVSENVESTPLVFNVIENSLNERMYYNASDSTQSLSAGVTIDNKTRLIKSEFTNFEPDNFIDFYGTQRVYISDDFGANFIISPKFIATNAYSLTNNRGLTVNTITDYINIIDKNTNFTVARISPSIDKSLAIYDFESTIGLDYPASLIELGNTHYGNNSLNSVTWDTKLNNCYAIVDDVLILKDPIGYAFFDTNTWLCVNSVLSPQRANFITSDGSVRSTDTGRISYNNPIISYGTSKAKYHIDDSSTVDSWALLSFETSSFTDGSYSEFYSSDFGTSFDISRDDFLSLFIPVVDWQSSNFKGYIFGAAVDSEPIDLFLNGNLSESSLLNLFIGPIETSSLFNISIPNITQRISQSDLSLNIANGNDIWSSEATIFLKTADNFNALNLVLFPPLQFNAALELSIDPPFPENKDINLFTIGSFKDDSSLDLQLENFPDNQVRQALLLQLNPDPTELDNELDLFIFGTTIAGSSYLDSGVNFSIDSLQGSSDSLDLEIAAPNSGTVDDSLLLKIHNEAEFGSASESLVFSIESFGVDVFFKPSSSVRNLSIKGADIINDAVPLFIKKSGIDGEESIDSVNLFIHNTVVSSGVDIIMDCNLVETGLINLTFNQVVGLENRNLNIFTRGFEE